MGEWQEQKQKFEEKLEEAARTIQEIFDADKDRLVIGEDYEKLKELKARNDRILHKLRTEECVVAIVGLEKAGKSTVGNAYIDSVVLPELTERCTFMTTKIVSGEVDEAEVTFYTRAEFDEKLRRMLKEVKYEGPNTLETVNLQNFNRYWSQLEHFVESGPADDFDESKKEEYEKKRALFEKHSVSTAEDIKRIMEGQAELKECLGKPARIFTGESEWKTDEFQKYITGIVGRSGESGEGHVIRKAYPFAVKDIVIRSTHLGSMKNIVLYDVPGFDSPTELHREETKKRMKEADAIILIVDVGTTPNLKSTQLDILRAVRDEDDIPLHEKVFVFGNRIDAAGNEKKARGNISALSENVDKYRIAKKQRIIVGSGKAYYQNNGLVSLDTRDDKDDKKIAELINGWNLEDGDGIECLRKKIREYNQTERYDILRQRAVNTIKSIDNCLQKIMDKYPLEDMGNEDDGNTLAVDALLKLEEFSRAASKIGVKYRDEILSNEEFSKDFKEKIDEIFPSTSSFPELIENAKHDPDIRTDSGFQFTASDERLREKVNQRFIENAIRAVTEAMERKDEEIRSALADSLLDVLGADDYSDDRQELKERAKELFDNLWNEKGAKCDAETLVQRSVTFVVEALIKSPYAINTAERYKKVVENDLPEFLALSVYYAFPTDLSSPRSDVVASTDEQARFFAKILAHEGIETPDGSIVSEWVRKFFQDNQARICQGENFIVAELPLAKWSMSLAHAGIKEMPEELSKSLMKLIYDNDNWVRQNLAQRINGINRCIEHYCQKKGNFTKESLMERLKKLKDRSNQPKTPTEDVMITELEADIKILREITTKSVVKAIGLERTFVNIFIKNINIIKLATREKQGRITFYHWIQRNIEKINAGAYKTWKEDQATKQTRKLIAGSIRRLLPKLQEVHP